MGKRTPCISALRRSEDSTLTEPSRTLGAAQTTIYTSISKFTILWPISKLEEESGISVIITTLTLVTQETAEKQDGLLINGSACQEEGSTPEV